MLHDYRVTLAAIPRSLNTSRPVLQPTPGLGDIFRTVTVTGVSGPTAAINQLEYTADHPSGLIDERIVSVEEIYDRGLLTEITDEQIDRMLFESPDTTNRLNRSEIISDDEEEHEAIIDTTAVDSEENTCLIGQLAALFTADPTFPDIDIETTTYPAQVRAEIVRPEDGPTVYRGVVLDMNRLTTMDRELRSPDAWHVLVRWLLNEIAPIL